MIRKIFAALTVLLAFCVGGAGIWLAFSNVDAEPVLLEAPEAARNQAVGMMDAVCSADYAAAARVLYGQPDLGMDRLPEDVVARMFYEAYTQSLEYTVVRDCYATSGGVALDVRVTARNIDAMLPKLRQQAEALLAQRVQDAEDVSQIYDENGEYRQTLVEEVLHTAAATVLQQENSTRSIDLTLECVFENGQWWILPSDTLLDVIGCRLGQ
jgi:hypothetical protein